MKVAISSASFAGRLATGDLTQLEWLEGTASTLGADGVVFAREHFPRIDDEYAAQLKKVALDLGLVPLAVVDFGFFEAATGDVERRATLELTAHLGAFFVIARLPPPGEIPPATFVATVGAAKAAVRIAKALNVTLLIRAAAGTLAQTALELRHFRKDVDSAWLRYALAAGTDRSPFNLRDRVLVTFVEADDDLERLVEIEESARPWLLLEGPVGEARVAALRRTAARRTLAAAML